ncbi:MAG: M24 family metallopeptidase [Chloroflexi bacterium]|nr:MAG: peptidase M24 [Phototrophicales bacterium]RMF78901.1 MAG: M24 family metallopeptidase [Chloroflexota bacterium]
MNRLQEIDHKHEQLRALLEARQADGIWLQRARNLFWMTAGADPTIPVDSEGGAYSILVTPDARTIFTNNIEATRLHAEDHLEDFGFRYREFAWHQPETPQGDGIISDMDANVEAEMQQLRWVLTEGEQNRLRALGRDAAVAIDKAARVIHEGVTEFEIASILDREVRKRGGVAVVNLIGTDERISKFRHPLPTDKQLARYAMLVVCMRRGGLIVSATRFAHIGPAPDELHDKMRAITAIDAAVMAASRPGRTLGEVFDDLLAAYDSHGVADQWQYHHQGGLGGYIARERIATPDDPTVLQAGQMCAWNPSLVGAKSEDTILINDNGFEIVTAHGVDWPTLEVNIDGQTVARPGILEI